MAMEFKKAKRQQARIKIALGGPSGSGKTMSSLLLAYGLVRAEFASLTEEACWEKIAVIDTENGSGSLYVGTTVGSTTIGEYNVIDIEPPFEPEKYINAIKMCEEHGMCVVIVDSLSHAWVGVGGALDQQGAIAARSGNSYTAWRTVTPQHNKLVDAMLQSRCHVIADIRAKMDYQQTTNEKGKKEVKAVGMGLQMRDGIEYEFTVAFMLDYEHVANATKDRTGLFDGRYFVITPEVGKAIYKWLSGSSSSVQTASPAQPPVETTKIAAEEYTPVPPPDDIPFVPDEAPQEVPESVITMEMLHASVVSYLKDKTPEQKAAIAAKVEQVCGTKNYKSITDQAMIDRLYHMFNK